MLPGGELLFTLGYGRNWHDARIVAQSLESGERKVLIQGGRDARYVATGHLVYVLDGTLLAVPFDADSLEVTGGPVPMAEGVMTGGGFAGTAQFAVSDAGSLVYYSGRRYLTERTLVWVDRQGREEALTAEPRAYGYPRISPDGGRVALEVRDQERTRNIWIWDFAREILTRLTFDPRYAVYPTWAPDGQRVVFGAKREGQLMAVPVQTEPSFTPGKAELVFERDYFASMRPTYDASPDGQRFLMIKESAGADATEFHFVLN